MTYREILTKLAQDNNGILKPSMVVDHARNPESKLHNAFEWDNTIAGEKYRLIQAQKLIQAQVVVLDEKTEPVRVFVNLSNERNTENGGYRLTVAVMGDDELKAQMIKDVVRELTIFNQKYKRLKELAEVLAVNENFIEKFKLVE